VGGGLRNSGRIMLYYSSKKRTVFPAVQALGITGEMYKEPAEYESDSSHMTLQFPRGFFSSLARNTFAL